METLIRTFKTQVYLSEDQEQLLKMLFGLSRAVYNHALDLVKSKAVRNNVYEMLKYIYDEIDSGTLPNKYLEEITEETGKIQHLYRQALEDVTVAVKNAKNISKKTKGKTEPELKYRRKKDNFQSVSIYGKNKTTILVDGPKTISVMMSRKVGYLTLTTRESVEFLEHRTNKIKTITIKVEAGKYYVSMTYERTKRQVAKPPENTLIALDLGVKYNVKWYDGTESGTWLFNTKKSKRSEELSQSMKLAKHHEGSKRYLKAL